MNKLLAFGFLVSLVVFLTEGSLLVMEEGTPNQVDWRQLRVELPPAYENQQGDLIFDRPVWTRYEGNNNPIPFPVLGSLICNETVEQSVAALIDGVWECVDINDPILPPPNNTVKRSLRASTQAGKIDPPSSCAWNEAPLMFNVSAQRWQCVDPDRALIQYVKYSPRPPCNDTDLVVYNEQEDWFECKALSKIPFLSTISKTDLRWQVPSTVRHIGIIASSTRVRSGGFQNFRWSTYVFTASSERVAYDQTTPPQVVTSGGADYLAYTLSTSFVAISGSGAYLKTVFNPVYPGSPAGYNTNITKAVPGAILRGESLTFYPASVVFNAAGTNTVTRLDDDFVFGAATVGRTQGLAVVPVDNAGAVVTVDAGSYPVVEIAETVSNWYVGTTDAYTPNLHLTISIWLRYSAPSGF